MNRIIRILCLFMIASLPLLAQEEELGVDAPDPGSSVPVDGGLSLLLAAGAAVGGRKIYRQTRTKKKGE